MAAHNVRGRRDGTVREVEEDSQSRSSVARASVNRSEVDLGSVVSPVDSPTLADTVAEVDVGVGLVDTNLLDAVSLSVLHLDIELTRPDLAILRRDLVKVKSTMRNPSSEGRHRSIASLGGNGSVCGRDGVGEQSTSNQSDSIELHFVNRTRVSKLRR